MRRPGFLADVEIPKPASDDKEAQGMRAEHLRAALEQIAKIGIRGPRVIHDCPGGKRYVEGHGCLNRNHPLSIAAIAAEKARKQKQQREIWLNRQLVGVFIRDPQPPQHGAASGEAGYLSEITLPEREMLLSNYDTLEPAMREYSKWYYSFQGKFSNTEPGYLPFTPQAAVWIPSSPSLCSNEYAAKAKSWENFLSERWRAGQGSPTLEERSRRQHLLERSAADSATFMKCLVRSNPSPIHKMLSRDRKAIPTEYRGPGLGPGPDRKVIPTELLIGAAVLAAILLLRKRSI